LPVRAQPGARRNAIVGEHRGALKVAVTAPPDKGKANDAIEELLCSVLNLRGSQVGLLSGSASRDKKFLIAGIKADDLVRQIQDRLQASKAR
jgi:hypothetical protein